ncbi:Adenosylcobalamin biosynthesis, ATP:cob(I)alamin adenosyltransferase-like protein [Halteromyces radiatus]|uniref:Adenosylcobalamin biosynthesis, ATP:cob(I)alamin adenosyltransferase-like protein n=1 Tax=Halteromyces radiatus TaxID=101107 RepID=UPI00221FA486|nr:Adenosylcobalamin biosynthesis, ATP:cob(I)alamin adenosyltransferase-like protein [Halteromyces radiatus]KAI8089328.1 Adenosylcobalamin biosynthesis, ATP:cob(I)alamin adenosyltransferase-like protein [Halteromyces radiatus]
MKIYTKTGDKGTSSLYNGERRDKDDIIFEALGTTDELSSHIGLAMEYLENDSFLTERLEKIQCSLQDIGSNIATPRERSNTNRLERTSFDPEGKLVLELEQWIDFMDEELPRLTKFILPSGGKASATLHVSRSVCRRAERRVQPLTREHLCDDSVAIYLNRLSDFLFNAARLAAKRQGKEEKVYVKPK